MSLQISGAEWQESKRRTDEWVANLGALWGWLEQPVHPMLEGQRAFLHRDGRLVVVNIGQHDGRWWLHVSVSRAKYIPSYEDLSDVKREFVGNRMQAVQVFARVERHVNIHPHCLHLWASLEPEGDGLPDFGKEGTI
ncbi:MAG: hypothetical protein E6J01_04030 [Chloroflexi bacterium]|nr:MAG: hypothetical protein E6J01_04030 [Chloroflexota bacterium]